ncbi:AAA family ATPase [Mycobacterium deserti]|uniref:AAA family ATPase n=1 Tax=Mycobacterium deserti TaxID=2978347 RepID=A0ABT2M3P5_9MYCO|nr:AAA family ATPase [Mycobacterium deserti]MCT7656882.1 AAA family ATPase [Mycobacterium deserti]
MKLHRMVLTNYRGITHREIEFPDRGVVVVCGANEIGKTSMIEALDLLLEAKDRSSKKEVKLVKPTHADVGAEITAEITTGPYRFVYRKRFHKRAETHLTVLAPQREQLTGDEAHDRARAMLDETVDTGLWQAQRVLQSSSTAAVDLSGCDALSRALDVAAGESAQLCGDEPLLVDRIESEYLRYFTRTGRPTGEWGAATNRLKAADQELARCAAAVAEVDEAVRRHAALTDDLARLAGERAAVATRLATAQAAADAVAAVTRQLKEAELVAAAAEAGRVAAVAAVTERRRLRADIDERASVIADLEAAVATAVDEQATAVEVQEAAEFVAAQARAAVEASQGRADAARRAIDQLADRDEAERLAARLAKIDVCRRELERTEKGLAGIALTEALMRTIEDASTAVELAAGQVELMSARIELTAAADVDLVVGGEAVRLAAGSSMTSSATAATEIELPGVLTARVVPGVPASQTQAKLDAAQGVLDTALAKAQVRDVAHARVVDGQRRELVGARERFRARLEALSAEEDIDALRARLSELQDREPADMSLFDIGVDAATARADLDAAVAAHQKTIADCETHRLVAEQAARRLGQKTTQASVSTEKLATVQGELTLARERLAAQRAVTTDDELAVTAQAQVEEADRAAALVAELGAELASTAPEAVAAALSEATHDAEALGRRHDQVTEALRDVASALKVYGTEGRKSQLDAAETEREHAEAEYSRVQRRARAAHLLRSVVARHRDATRLRYVDPFRNEVERLGRIVFGESFEVEIDTDLRICSRTVSGRTVPYDSLSGGAKEQLGIVARLAGAALVAKEDTVPVVIDDALGFTDADRLTKMGAVFNAVGGDGQVIVLTCSPQRYAAVAGAHHIELTA